jgi:hypothetical protein
MKVQNNLKQMMGDGSKTGIDFLSSASSNVRAYQAQLLEVAQANMQFAFEFAQTLASIRSPAEFPRIIAEFTSKRIALFRKHSTELAELGTRRWTYDANSGGHATRIHARSLHGYVVVDPHAA